MSDSENSLQRNAPVAETLMGRELGSPDKKKQKQWDTTYRPCGCLAIDGSARTENVEPLTLQYQGTYGTSFGHRKRRPDRGDNFFVAFSRLCSVKVFSK